MSTSKTPPRPRSIRIDLGESVGDIEAASEWGRARALDFIDTYPDRALQGAAHSCVYTNLRFGGPVYWTPGNTVVVRVGRGRDSW